MEHLALQKEKGQLKIQAKKLLTRSVSMAVLFCFNLLCTVQAQGIEGAPAGTGISDRWYYDGAQLYERWKFAPTISCFMASILTALAAVVRPGIQVTACN